MCVNKSFSGQIFIQGSLGGENVAWILPDHKYLNLSTCLGEKAARQGATRPGFKRIEYFTRLGA